MGRRLEHTFFQRWHTHKIHNITNDQGNANENHNEVKHVRERQIPYDFKYMWNLKQMNKENLQTQIINGYQKGGGKGWEKMDKEE